MKSQFRSKRKVSGKKYVAFRKKRVSDLGGLSALTHIGSKRVKVKRVMGANSKRQLLSDEVVYIADGNKTIKAKIEGVSLNPANINYTRRNIITKGAILETELGYVKVTSRPGQDGQINGVISDYKTKK